MGLKNSNGMQQSEVFYCTMEICDRPWGICTTMETCNENCKSEHSKLSNMENVQKIKFQNQYHLLKSWTLSFRDM